MKHLFLDVESTYNPINPRSSILEIHGILREDKTIVDTLDLKLKPKENTIYKFKALRDKGIKHKESPLPSNEQGFSLFKTFLDKHVNRYDWNDKLCVLAYNASWEQQHLMNWFTDNGEGSFIGSYFHLPFFCIKSYANLNKKVHGIKKKSLADVARLFDIKVNKKLLHSAKYDNFIALGLYDKLTD